MNNKHKVRIRHDCLLLFCLWYGHAVIVSYLWYLSELKQFIAKADSETVNMVIIAVSTKSEQVCDRTRCDPVRGIMITAQLPKALVKINSGPFIVAIMPQKCQLGTIAVEFR